MMQNQLSQDLDSVVLYRNVRDGQVLSRFYDLVCSEDSGQNKIKNYSEFVAALYEAGGDFGEYLQDALLYDDNIYVRMSAEGKQIPAYMKAEFERELRIFSSLSCISSAGLLHDLGLPANLAGFESSEKDFVKIVLEELKSAATTGYGIYARHGMFKVLSDGTIAPVPSPDPITLDDLIGYEMERKQVIDNTRALLEGKPAANALLTGDAGTGKSSTIKAVANYFRKDGLRLIEMKKEQIPLLGVVMGEIRENPLKFIIFIDDLTFIPNDTNFGTLKAVLEGSASACADNAVIYATSNRRHMIKETFSSRDGDDIHRNDTIEEQSSLSARFGLNILYQKPDKKLYLTIVHALAERKGIKLADEEIDLQAEAFALRKGRRSARVAEQFIDSLVVAGKS